jgi:hypothetical protein
MLSSSAFEVRAIALPVTMSFVQTSLVPERF